MSYNRYDEDKNSTVSWIPSFFREFLGLTGEYRRPEYGNYGSSKREIADSTTSWMPGFFRRWVGIEYSEPKRYGPSSPAPERRSERRPAAPPPQRSYTPPPSSARSDYGSNRNSYGSGQNDYAAPRPEGAERMRFGSGSENYSSESGPVMQGGGEQPARFEGYVKPITYGVRGYLRGALPPQGLEAFLRQFRTTVQDVTGMYQKVFELQTRELTDAVDSWRRQRPAGRDTQMTQVAVETGDAPAASNPNPSPAPAANKATPPPAPAASKPTLPSESAADKPTSSSEPTAGQSTSARPWVDSQSTLPPTPPTSTEVKVENAEPKSDEGGEDKEGNTEKN
jgi:hypothetical protein